MRATTGTREFAGAVVGTSIASIETLGVVESEMTANDGVGNSLLATGNRSPTTAAALAPASGSRTTVNRFSIRCATRSASDASRIESTAATNTIGFDVRALVIA